MAYIPCPYCKAKHEIIVEVPYKKTPLQIPCFVENLIDKGETLRDIRREFIIATFYANRNDVRKTAKVLGVSEKTVMKYIS